MSTSQGPAFTVSQGFVILAPAATCACAVSFLKPGTSEIAATAVSRRAYGNPCFTKPASAETARDCACCPWGVPEVGRRGEVDRRFAPDRSYKAASVAQGKLGTLASCRNGYWTRAGTKRGGSRAAASPGAEATKMSR
eukprot:3839951-Pleurochrysis_carterae.AAC.2